MRFRFAIVASVVILAAFTASVLAADTKCIPRISVATYDAETSMFREIFNQNDCVNITAYTETCPYEIKVIDSEGIIRFADTSYEPRYSKDVCGITDKLGWWEIKAGSHTTYFATAYYNVIPEVPLGVFGILSSCFAALGIIKFRKRN